MDMPAIRSLMPLSLAAPCMALALSAPSPAPARAQSVGERAAQGLAETQGAAPASGGPAAAAPDDAGDGDGDSDQEIPGPPPDTADSDEQVAGPPKAPQTPVIPRGVGFNQKGGQLSAMALESAAIGNPEFHYHVMGPGTATPAGYANAPMVNPQTTQPNWHYHVVSGLGAGSMDTSQNSHWHYYNSSGGAGQVPGPAPEYLGGIGAYGGATSMAGGQWAFGGLGAGNAMFAAYD